jgi:hypothetical protein
LIGIRAWYLKIGCVVVDRGPCEIFDQWLCNNGLWSMRDTIAVYMLWTAVRGWFLINGSIVVDFSPCVVLEQ